MGRGLELSQSPWVLLLNSHSFICTVESRALPSVWMLTVAVLFWSRPDQLDSGSPEEASRSPGQHGPLLTFVLMFSRLSPLMISSRAPCRGDLFVVDISPPPRPLKCTVKNLWYLYGPTHV